jgi:homocysteine S-methyltransferase
MYVDVPAPAHTGGVSGGVVVLDGGLSTVLEEQGHRLTDSLWTARVLLDDPAAIAAAHRAYFDAGARVATTASYQMSVPSLQANGLSRAQSRAALTRSVTLARQVRDGLAADGVQRWVAASVGPYGAVLADGSEYRGRYGLSAVQLRDFHGPRLEVLAAAGPDLLAVETIPDIDEAEVLVGLLAQLGVPAWFSFAEHRGRTRAGQPLAEAFAVAASARTVRAVGVNCCDPDEVLDAVQLAVEVTGRPAVAYPNGGEQWDPAHRRWVGRPRFDPALVLAWAASGAEWVGGCCRVGPATIARVAAEVRATTRASGGADRSDRPAGRDADRGRSP